MTTKEYREKHEIIADMLRTIGDSGTKGVSKTTIMYKSFLSFAQLKEYLLFSIKRRLVEEYHHRRNEEENKGETKASGDRLNYKITEKGLHLLEICDKINELIGPEGNNNELR